MSKPTMPDAPISAMSNTIMLRDEKESPLFKEYNAALVHLAALEDAKEIEFFLQTMEKITERKLEEEAAAYSAYYDNKKREEINYLIDVENRKQQEQQPHKIETHIPAETHFTQLILTVLVYHLNQLAQAQHQVVAAQAAQVAIQRQWQNQQNALVTNVESGLLALGIAPAQVNQVREQLQMGTGLLPLQNIQKLGLHDVAQAYQQEVKQEADKARHEQDENGAPLSDKRIDVLSQQRAANKMNFVPRHVVHKKIPIIDAIKNDHELMQAKQKDHPHLNKFKLADFIADHILHLDDYQKHLQDLQDQDIVEKANEKASQKRCEQHEVTANRFIEAAIKIIKDPHTREQLLKLNINKPNSDAVNAIKQYVRRG